MSVHSNDGATWSTKLNRIGELSRSNKKIVFNNLGHIIDRDFLLDCFKSLDGKKAVGVDRVTKEMFEYDLSANLDELLVYIRRGTYIPQPGRLVEIPKEDGSQRPLVISCIADKVVQLAVNRILTAIYEPRFLECSYGYRPGRSAYDAICDLNKSMMRVSDGQIVEIDLCKYFNSVPHSRLMDFLQLRISDRRFLSLLGKLMTNPIEGQQSESIGVPQGMIVSPVLANIYLHYVIDEWFDELRKSFFKSKASEFRFADDLVFVFEDRVEAEKFHKALPKRLTKFGLELNEAKSSTQICGHRVVERQLSSKGKMPRFNFLGFTVMWKRSRRGRYRPYLKPRASRMTATLRRTKGYLWRNLNHPNHMIVLTKVRHVMRGWQNYFSLTDCGPIVWRFIYEIRHLIYKWFNRRGKRGAMNWEKLNILLKKIGLHPNIRVRSIYKFPKAKPFQLGSPLP